MPQADFIRCSPIKHTWDAKVAARAKLGHWSWPSDGLFIFLLTQFLCKYAWERDANMQQLGKHLSSLPKAEFISCLPIENTWDAKATAQAKLGSALVVTFWCLFHSSFDTNYYVSMPGSVMQTCSKLANKITTCHNLLSPSVLRAEYERRTRSIAWLLLLHLLVLSFHQQQQNWNF